MRLTTFNVVDRVDAVSLLTSCADVSSWVGALADGRPYPDIETLVAAADTLAGVWTHGEVRAALARHPRIGDRPTGDHAEAAMSRDEQSGVAGDGVELRDRLHEGNLAYERRFGRIFLIRAAGRTGPEILAALERRLGQDDETELDETAGQLREIALLRLRGVLSEDAA